MDDLITVENGEPMTTSLKIAEVFGKRHTDVLETIRNKIEKIDELEESGNFRSPKFIESSFINSQNKKHMMYKLNKDALVLVVMNYQTKEALKFQLNYIDAFNGMQKQLESQNQFFMAETIDQQLEREKLALRKRTADTSRAREIRSWAKASDKTKEVISLSTPKVLSMLLEIPEEQLALEVK